MSLDMTCPIKNCNDRILRDDMSLNSHLKNKHNCSQAQRTRLRMKHCPRESGFKTQGISEKERDLSNLTGIK